MGYGYSDGSRRRLRGWTATSLLIAALGVPLAAQQNPPLPGLEFLSDQDLESARRRSEKTQIKAAVKPAAPAPKPVAKPAEPAEPAAEPAPAQPDKVLLAWMNVPRLKPNVESIDPAEQLHQAATTPSATPVEQQSAAQPRAAFRGGPQFRNLRWGFTRAEVEAAEKSLGKPRVLETGTSSTIAFNQVEVAARKSYLLCTFVFNKLARGVYVFKDQLPDDQDWFAEMSQLVDALSEKYGRPNRQEVNWTEDLYRNEQRYWGLALRRGHVQFENSWDLPETTIRLKLAGTRYGISLSLSYESKFYGQVLSEVERRKRQAGL